MPCKWGIWMPRFPRCPISFRIIITLKKWTSVSGVALDIIKWISSDAGGPHLFHFGPWISQGEQVGRDPNLALRTAKPKRQVRKAREDWKFYSLSLKLDTQRIKHPVLGKRPIPSKKKDSKNEFIHLGHKMLAESIICYEMPIKKQTICSWRNWKQDIQRVTASFSRCFWVTVTPWPGSWWNPSRQALSVEPLTAGSRGCLPPCLWNGAADAEKCNFPVSAKRQSIMSKARRCSSE